MKQIYLDHSASTPVDKEVLKEMLPYFSEKFGNASSLHQFGQEAKKAVEKSRQQVAKFLNCEIDEIFFTGTTTEANNIAIRGIVLKGDHMITTQFEHPAVFEVCKYLEKNGVEVSYLKPNSDGLISVNDVKDAIKKNTKLISIMYVNNEIGTIQPIQEIGELAKENNILFHTDAVQAANYLQMDVKKLNVDLLTISGHKIYGPKGIGILYKNKNVKLNPIIFGGLHEKGIRPGTLNVPTIIGIGKAIELISKQDNSKIKKLRDNCWQQIQDKIEHVKLNGSLENRAPHNLNINIMGVEGEAIMLELSLKGIAISTGSACASEGLKQPHVLQAIGLTPEESHGSLRITLGKDNTQEEINFFVKELVQAVKKFRKISPIK